MSLMSAIGSLELGIIFAIMALGVFISFRTLNMPDLTVDGSFVLGAAVSAIMCAYGHFLYGILFAFLAGCIAGSITALLHTKLKIQPLLSGILTMLALYSINLKVMGNKSNIPLHNKETIFKVFESFYKSKFSGITLSFAILLIITILLFLFLKTNLGFALRATGDNDEMVRSLGFNTDFTKLVGLALSNGLVSLSGAFIAQYQLFADVGMGTGMVVIGLASVIIGEVIFDFLFRKSSLVTTLCAVIFGAVLYRFVIAFALVLGMPSTDLKLVSAIIVAVALSMTVIKDRFDLIRKKQIARSCIKGGSL